MRTFGPIVHSSKQPCSVWDISAAETITSSLPAARSSSVASVLFDPRLEQCFLTHTSILRAVCMEMAPLRAGTTERAGEAACMKTPAQQQSWSMKTAKTRMRSSNDRGAAPAPASRSSNDRGAAPAPASPHLARPAVGIVLSDRPTPPALSATHNPHVTQGAMAIAAVAAILATAIYPAGHWDHATKLTPSNFEPFVKENVDAGKTLIVRWIASAG